MAAVSLLGSATFTTASGTKTVTATPAVNDLIVIITAHTGNTSSTAPTDDQGGTYTLVETAVKATSADTMRAWIRDSAIPRAVSTVFTHAPGTSTGGGLAVLKVTGMSRAGASAERQSAKQDNQASATPTPVFSVAALTSNPVIGAVFNATSPATLTPRSSPAYGELADVGYSTPTSGLEVMSINSGETGTSIAWGGSSASAFGSLVLELDTTVPPLLANLDTQQTTPAPARKQSGLIEVGQSLLLTTLAVAAVTAAPRAPVMFSVQPKPYVSAEVAPNLLTRSGESAPTASQPIRLVPQRPALQADTARNLTIVLPPASTVQARTPVYFSTQKRPDVQDTTRGFTPQVANDQIASAQSTLSSPERRPQAQARSFSSPQVLLGTEVLKPFAAPAFDAALHKKPVGAPFFPGRAADAQAPAVGVPFTVNTFEGVQRRAIGQAFYAPNLLHSTLDLPPIASAMCEWPPTPVRPAVNADGSRSSPLALLSTVVLRPFAAPPFDQAMRRPLNAITLDMPGVYVAEPPVEPPEVQPVKDGRAWIRHGKFRVYGTPRAATRYVRYLAQQHALEDAEREAQKPRITRVAKGTPVPVPVEYVRQMTQDPKVEQRIQSAYAAEYELAFRLAMARIAQDEDDDEAIFLLM